MPTNRCWITFGAALALALGGCSDRAPDRAGDTGTREGRAAAAPLTLTRLDCGTAATEDLSVFSTAGNYKGMKKELADGCYLIRHGDTLMLWDTGLPAELAGKPPQSGGGFMLGLKRSLADQLAELGLSPADIDLVGISHYHVDHTGQLPVFANARLLIGKGDWDAVVAKADDVDPAPFAPWLRPGARVQPVSGDHDVFGDGSVVMLDLPGHTPGHHGLRVNLAETGPVLLTGDVTHFAENYANDGVPTWNTDPKASVASIGRFKQMARDTGARVVIQHEPADIAKLPGFPEAAR